MYWKPINLTKMYSYKKILGCRISTIIAFLTLTTVVSARYFEPDSYKNPRRVVTLDQTPGFSTQGLSNHSALFQRAIDRVTGVGGHVVVPPGNYNIMEIKLKNNVHLRIRRGAVLNSVGAGVMFRIGSSNLVRNVSVRGFQGRCRINLKRPSNNNGVRAFFTQYARNVKLEHINITDAETVFSSIVMAWGGKKNETTAKDIRDVEIRNVDVTGAEYGYGLIQTHAARNCQFRNLKARGGATVRFETHDNRMLRERVGGVRNMTVNNITNTDGQAALMTQPHTARNGNVDVRGITSVGSSFGVLLERGFVNRKLRELDIGLTPGRFSKIKVRNVTATHTNKANPKFYSHLKWYAKSRQSSVRVAPNSPGGYRGPSITGIANEINDNTIDAPRWILNAKNFPGSQKTYMLPGDRVSRPFNITR